MDIDEELKLLKERRLKRAEEYEQDEARIAEIAIEELAKKGLRPGGAVITDSGDMLVIKSVFMSENCNLKIEVIPYVEQGPVYTLKISEIASGRKLDKILSLEEVEAARRGYIKLTEGGD